MSTRISGFDGLRGLAASAVVLHHFGYRGTALGDVAVLVFFVLSGYLIVGILHSMRGAIEAGNSTVSSAIGEFWRRRALRILPAFYLVFAAAYVGEGIAGYLNLKDGLLWYLTFTQNFYVGMIQPFWLTMAHTWTIAVEQQFYLVIAPLLLIVPRNFQWVLVLFLVVAGAVVTMALHGIGMSDHELRILPFHGMSYLAAGGLTYFLCHSISRQASLGLAAPICALALFLVSQPDLVPSDWGFRADRFWPNVVCLLASCGLVASCALDQRSRWVGWLEWRPLVYLGTISYGLYIVHVPLAWLIGKPVHGAIQALGVTGPAYGMLFFALLFAASVAVASLMWFLVERPFLSMGRKRLLQPLAA